MDNITEQLSQLQELSNEELSALEESVLNEFSATEEQELTSQSVTRLSQLADAVEAVRAEQSRRATEAAALQSAAAEASARVKGTEAAMAPAEEDTTEVVAVGEPDAEDIADGGADDALEGDAPAPDAAPIDAEDIADGGVDEAEEGEAPIAPDAIPAIDAAPDAAPDAEDAEDIADGGADEDTENEVPGEDDNEKAKKPVVASTEASVEETHDDEAAVAEESAEEESTELSDEAPVEAEAAVEAPVEAEASNEETTTITEDTVTAAANGSEGLNIEVPAGREPLVKPATTLTITAGADVPGISAGTSLKDTLEVADAFQRRLHSLRHVHGGDGEQHIVASFRQEFPESRTLTANDPLENTDRIQGVTSAEAIVAAAGVCLPLETQYDLGCDVGVTDRPVRDALARFGADRGGIRFFTAPTLSQSSPAFANATGFWRGDGSDPNSGAWHTYGPDRTTATSPADQKPCLEMNCVAEETAYIEAITLCLTFNNLTTRTFPELIKRQNELALVAHSRVAENALLAQIKAGGTAITAQAQVVGATREILNLFDRAVASYRFKHRMSDVAPLRAIIPMWVNNLLRADLALQMPGDGLDVLDLAQAQIDAWFKSRGVNATWHLDGVGPAAVDLDGAGSGTAVGFEFPSAIEFDLFAEGTWLFLDGGTLDLGVIRDSSLVATNQYKQFVETFEGVANVGCDSYHVTAAYKPTGAAAALVDTSL